MDERLRDIICDSFDTHPASVDEYRAITRSLVEYLSLTAEEVEIMTWDAGGRSNDEQERLATKAWNFSEVGGLASRRRLFAGFVTAGGATDGYGADYLIDFALASGIAAREVFNAMATRRPQLLVQGSDVEALKGS